MKELKKFNIIFKKEFKTYFVSPIAYIVIAIFLFVTGWLFFSTFFLQKQAELRNFFSLLPITFTFIVPIITMRLFSEEFNMGTYEILLTMPVTLADVIIGKFLAAFSMVAIMLAPTLSYALFITFLGKLDWGVVAGGYLGALLLGAMYSAIGIMASSLSKNQIIAVIIGVLICFFLTLIDKMLFFLPNSLVVFFQYLSADFHFQNIAKGIIDSRDIIYFFSISFIALYGTNLIIQEKK